MSQSKDLDVSHCEGYDELRSLFFDEFPAALKGLRPRHMQLFCLAPPPVVNRAKKHSEPRPTKAAQATIERVFADDFALWRAVDAAGGALVPACANVSWRPEKVQAV